MKQILVYLIGLLFIAISSGFAKVTGIGTGWKGKVGNMVFAGWKGEQVVKTRAIPQNPRSAGQVANRTCLSEIVFALKFAAVELIRPLWHPFTTAKQSGWGNCISKNKLAMGQTFDPEKLILSHGSLEKIHDLSADYNPELGLLSLDFDQDHYSNGTKPDKIGVACFDSNSVKIAGFDLDAGTRGDSGCTLNIPKGLTPENIRAIAWAYRVDEEDVVNIISTSQNVAVTVAT